MKKAIETTERRRKIQQAYNEEHGITPTQIQKSLKQSDLHQFDESASTQSAVASTAYIGPTEAAYAADPIIERMTRQQLEKSIAQTTRLMKDAAKKLDFLQAAQYRDEIIRLQKELELK